MKRSITRNSQNKFRLKISNFSHKTLTIKDSPKAETHRKAFYSSLFTHINLGWEVEFIYSKLAPIYITQISLTNLHNSYTQSISI